MKRFRLREKFPEAEELSRKEIYKGVVIFAEISYDK